MQDWKQDFYKDLGRYVKCPKCGLHSDLALDRAAVPLDDQGAYRLSIEGTALHGCLLFHEEPLFAWLWFKHHKKENPSPESPSDSALTDDGRIVPPESDQDLLEVPS